MTGWMPMSSWSCSTQVRISTILHLFRCLRDCDQAFMCHAKAARSPAVIFDSAILVVATRWDQSSNMLAWELDWAIEVSCLDRGSQLQSDKVNWAYLSNKTDYACPYLHLPFNLIQFNPFVVFLLNNLCLSSLSSWQRLPSAPGDMQRAHLWRGCILLSSV